MKALQIFLLVLIIIGLGLIFTRDKWVPKLIQVILSQDSNGPYMPIFELDKEPNTNTISITPVSIKEENFTGIKSVLSGSGLLVLEAQKYIDSTVAEFKTQADRDVPDMRKQFGADNPTANYTLDVLAKEYKSTKYNAVIISVYTFTGGAHGSSYYKVFNTTLGGDKILSLSDVIKKEKQTAFTELVKKELNAWRPDGTIVVFPETVTELTFASFKSWNLDDKNINIYFDQYEIGPGVLGAVVFPISLEKIKDLLN